MKVCKYADEAVFSAEKPAGQVISKGAHSRTTIWSMEAGQEIHPHAHDGDHVWVVVEGRGHFLTDDARTPVEVGSIVFAPEGESHGMRAETRLVFVSVSAGGKH